MASVPVRTSHTLNWKVSPVTNPSAPTSAPHAEIKLSFVDEV